MPAPVGRGALPQTSGLTIDGGRGLEAFRRDGTAGEFEIQRRLLIDHARGRPDARVRPNHRILNARAFFNKAALAEYGINNLCAWLDLAVVTDY